MENIITIPVPDEPATATGRSLVLNKSEDNYWSLHWQVESPGYKSGLHNGVYGHPAEVLQSLIERLQARLNYWRRAGTLAETVPLSKALEEVIQLKKGYEHYD